MEGQHKKYRQFLRAVLNFIFTQFSLAIDFLWPKIRPCVPLAEAIISSYLKDEVLVFFGLMLLFFGVNFVYTFAAFEAWVMYGYENAQKFFSKLINQVKNAREFAKSNAAHDTDEPMPENNQDLPDYADLTASQRISAVVRALDPKEVSSCFVGILGGILSAFASLRLRGPQSLVVGSSIGDTFYGLFEYYLVEILVVKEVVPKDYQKWVLPCVAYGTLPAYLSS
eukprot:TRINITY_DN4858_c0_g1_i1.p1 TRINITY_DN4858_c0_g1~~TRINITY_DN4858_c0_g1_i1.p1  ORF type:complete len:235 (-),score=26.08 TRINITY_DN4858_c0_g1_i1:342-1016(-)